MTYSLTVTHVDEQAVVRVLHIGRQGIGGPPAPEWQEAADAPIADMGEVQFLFGWDGDALVKVSLEALAEFFGVTFVDNNDYAAWVAAF